MSNYLKKMGMQCMPILSPMASVPSNKATRKDNNRALTISGGVQMHVTRETMLTHLNNQEILLLMTDTNPYMIGSVIITKGRPVTAYSRNLTGQPRRTTTRNEIRSIIMKLRAQPDVFAETNNRSVRHGHLDAMGDIPWQLLLNRDNVTLTYLPVSDPVAADEISRQERHQLLLDPHSTA
jgi:hypothetical protein